MMRNCSLILTGCVLQGAALAAQPLPQVNVLPATLALKAVTAAVEQCQTDGYRVSAAVVDRGGVVLAQLRHESAGMHTADSSRRKAYSAVSLRESTQKIADLVAVTPALAGLHHINDSLLILGGGLPIRLGNDIIGGIGVGGAPGTALDETCARAGIAVIEKEMGTTP